MVERWLILVKGVVQGVGYRPFVYGVAKELGVRGWVRNEVGVVRVEGEAESAALEKLVTKLKVGPALAHVESVEWEKIGVIGEAGFEIRESGEGTGGAVVTPDAGICGDCLRELFDPADRRFRYPFINCTNCGPRLTIVTGAPYDRAKTTMAGFVMCDDCRREYEDPSDRRFHAQPVACAKCGPRLLVMDGKGKELEGREGDAIEVVCGVLRGGGIAAIKGIGGFHLACDARNAAAVAELRRRKLRDEKPFAVMVRDVAAAEGICEVSEEERGLLMGWRRPIVLLRGRAGNGLAELVAPGNPFVGVMVAYTPVHALLFQHLEERQRGTGLRTAQTRGTQETVLVMTSGNRADEPIAFEDAEAVERLGRSGIADVILGHDRGIHTRCDDSVTRVFVGGGENLIRRSRGYAPEPIGLPMECARGVLAVGGQLKGTFALGREREAIVSHHLGDLDHLEAYRAFVRDIGLYEELFRFRPDRGGVIACDLHPDYASTRYARQRARELGCELVAVQHHHAHMASCMAENGIGMSEKVIGVSFDGTGYGTDGAIWGGEFLVGDYAGFERAGYLRYVGLPGGDAAVKEIWRMGLVQMLDAGVSCERFLARVKEGERKVVEKMIERGFNTPRTSSMGRLFDAVAALAGVRESGKVSFEGQGAMELEWAAEKHENRNSKTEEGYTFGIEEDPGARSQEPEGGRLKAGLRTDDRLKPVLRTVDTRPLVREVVEDVEKGVEVGVIGRRFHAAVVEMMVEMCRRIRSDTRVDCVVLSGGVFMNSILLNGAMERLGREGFRVYRHRVVPANDGGLCLGQIAVAAARGLGRP